jgi:phosphate transport system ATP-binding protein
MVFQKPNPVPDEYVLQRPYVPERTACAARAKLDEIVEQSLRDAAIWTRSRTG